MLWMSKLASKPVKHQKGFTLLELLMVIAVIGLLASIAVPRFQNYNQRARFTEVINAVGPYKTAVEMCATNLGTVSGCDAASNNIPAAAGEQGRVSSVNVVNGVITATGTAEFNQGDDKTTYVLTPTFNNNGLTWAVGGNCLDVELCQ